MGLKNGEQSEDEISRGYNEAVGTDRKVQKPVTNVSTRRRGLLLSDRHHSCSYRCMLYATCLHQRFECHCMFLNRSCFYDPCRSGNLEDK